MTTASALPSRSRSFRRLRSCRLRCITKVQGSAWAGLSSRAWAAWCLSVWKWVYHGTPEKKKWQNLGKEWEKYWFTSNAIHETWHLFSLHNWRNQPFDDVETSLDHLVLEPLRHVQPNLVFIILSHCHESMAQNVGNKIHLGQFLVSVHCFFCRWQHPIIQSA